MRRERGAAMTRPARAIWTLWRVDQEARMAFWVPVEPSIEPSI
jgi:hypothetical protein